MRPTKRKQIAGAAVAALGIGVGLGFATGGSSGSQARTPSPAEIQALRADALAFAKANGESAPTGGVIASGNRRDVVAATMGGAQVDTSQDVFVVRLHGSFVGYQAPVPRASRSRRARTSRSCTTRTRRRSPTGTSRRGRRT